MIVVDDGSVDATREVCRDFETTLALRYLRVNHSGIAAAKNHGVRAATGSILLFADDDNIVWGMSADKDVTWGSSGEDEVTYPDDPEVLPSTIIDFTIVPVVTTISSFLGGL